jgi:hypothetical protein
LFSNRANIPEVNMTAVPALIERIKAKGRAIAQGEGNLVLSVIDLARDFASLQNACPRRWLKELKLLGYDQRVARRYTAVGGSCLADPSRPIGPDLAGKLPYDLDKLEWLRRLPEAGLVELLTDIDVQKEGRSRVIKAVRRGLGQTPVPAAQARVTAEAVLKKWQKYVASALDAIGALGDDAATEEARQGLATELEAKFLEIQDALFPVLEEDASGPSQEGEDAQGRRRTA